MRTTRVAAAIVLVACGLIAFAIGSAGRPTSATAASAAASPTDTTGSSSNVTQSSATVSGTVNPQGTDTHYYFQYGTSTAYGAKTTSTDAGAGTADVAVTANLTGLNPSTAYHYQIVAVNSAGDTTVGTDQTFKTTTPPTVTTGSASNATRSSARLNGTVNPESQATTYYFRYGTTTSYGLQTTPASAGSGSGVVAVNASVSGLAADTTYHYQLVAQNNGGTSFGTDQTLTTTSSQVVVLGHEGFVSPGWVVGVELGCFHGSSQCTGHVTMTHNGGTIAQSDYSMPADSGGFHNLVLNSTGKSELGQNSTFHLLPVTVNVTSSSGQKLSYVIHLARWVWH